MARIRTVKPEFWKHEGLSGLPEATILLAVALLNYADDEGYFKANPKLVQADCCPLREPSVPITVSLSELSSVGYLQLGSGADGRQYGRIQNFSEHQVINKPKPSKIRPLDILWVPSRSSTVRVPDQSRQEQGREQGTGNREGNGEGAVALAAYAWSGKVIRLSTSDYAQWKQAYRQLDLDAELLAYDHYLVEKRVKSNWFARTSKYLANRNLEAKSKGQAQGPPRSVFRDVAGNEVHEL
jgi:hypothetical protein